MERGVALLDQSALTGEALPVQRATRRGRDERLDQQGPPFDLSATKRAAESTYANILRLVEAAQRVKAPMSRLADRYALGFLALTLTLAGGGMACHAATSGGSLPCSSSPPPARSSSPCRWR